MKNKVMGYNIFTGFEESECLNSTDRFLTLGVLGALIRMWHMKGLNPR